MALTRGIFYFIHDENYERTFAVCHTKTEAEERLPSLQRKADMRLVIREVTEEEIVNW